MGTESVNTSLNLITIVTDLIQIEEEEVSEADAVKVMIEGGLRASLIGSEQNLSTSSYGTFYSDSQDLDAKVRKSNTK